MTISNALRVVGVRAARNDLRSILKLVGQGTPVGVMTHNQPLAVLIREDEAGRCRHIEHALSALHGLEIYPELAHDTAALAAVVRGEVRAESGALQRLARQRREIVGSARFIGLTKLRLHLGAALEQARTGPPLTVVSYGHPRALLISFREYQRLVQLARIVIWFEAAGLDLAATEPDAVVHWVAAFRARTTCTPRPGPRGEPSPSRAEATFSTD